MTARPPNRVYRVGLVVCIAGPLLGAAVAEGWAVLVIALAVECVFWLGALIAQADTYRHCDWMKENL